MASLVCMFVCRRMPARAILARVVWTCSRISVSCLLAVVPWASQPPRPCSAHMGMCPMRLTIIRGIPTVIPRGTGSAAGTYPGLADSRIMPSEQVPLVRPPIGFWRWRICGGRLQGRAAAFMMGGGPAGPGCLLCRPALEPRRTARYVRECVYGGLRMDGEDDCLMTARVAWMGPPLESPVRMEVCRSTVGIYLPTSYCPPANLHP